MTKKTGEFARHKLVEDLLAWGWPLERLEEIEYGLDPKDPELPGMKYFDLKKLWTEWKKGARRLDTAKALGASEEQAPEVVRWSGRALDTVRKACLRSGVSPGRRQEFFQVSRAALQGLLANPEFVAEDPVITARKAVTYAAALTVEINRMLDVEHQTQQDATHSAA